MKTKHVCLSLLSSLLTLPLLSLRQLAACLLLGIIWNYLSPLEVTCNNFRQTETNFSDDNLPYGDSHLAGLEIPFVTTLTLIQQRLSARTALHMLRSVLI